MLLAQLTAFSFGALLELELVKEGITKESKGVHYQVDLVTCVHSTLHVNNESPPISNIIC